MKQTQSNEIWTPRFGRQGQTNPGDNITGIIITQFIIQARERSMPIDGTGRDATGTSRFYRPTTADATTDGIY
jgi:hypothetical protein